MQALTRTCVGRRAVSTRHVRSQSITAEILGRSGALPLSALVKVRLPCTWRVCQLSDFLRIPFAFSLNEFRSSNALGVESVQRTERRWQKRADSSRGSSALTGSTGSNSSAPQEDFLFRARTATSIRFHSIRSVKRLSSPRHSPARAFGCSAHSCAIRARGRPCDRCIYRTAATRAQRAKSSRIAGIFAE